MILSIASLAVTLLAAFAYADGRLTDAANKIVLLAASMMWFVAAPFWMKEKSK